MTIKKYYFARVFGLSDLTSARTGLYEKNKKRKSSDTFNYWFTELSKEEFLDYFNKEVDYKIAGYFYIFCIETATGRAREIDKEDINLLK